MNNQEINLVGYCGSLAILLNSFSLIASYFIFHIYGEFIQSNGLTGLIILAIAGGSWMVWALIIIIFNEQGWKNFRKNK